MGPVRGPVGGWVTGHSGVLLFSQAIRSIGKWLQIRVLPMACLFLDNLVKLCQGENRPWLGS